MATTQTHSASRAATVTTSSTFNNPISKGTAYSSSKGNRTQFQEDQSPRYSPRSHIKAMDDRKRRLETDKINPDQGRYRSLSPPPSRSNAANREDNRQTPNSRNSRLGAGNGHASPRTQLPSFTNLTSGVAPEEGESHGKRRKVDGGDNSRPGTRESGRPFSSPNQEFDDEDDRQYRRELATARQQPGNRRNGQLYSPQHAEHYESSRPQGANDRRQSLMGEDGYDSNVPLARRRGDAAQAKASRLHIDTASAEAGSSFESAAGAALRVRPTSLTSHGIAKSAPPHKISFSDQEGRNESFDPRGEPPPSLQPRGGGGGGGAAQGSNHPYYPSGYPNNRKEGAVQEPSTFNDASPTHARRPDYGAHQHGGPPLPHQQHIASALPSAVHRHGAGVTHSVGTPLTAVRNSAFVPQTATLPSPAYHTTHFMRSNPMGAGAAGGSGNLAHNQDGRTNAPVGSAAAAAAAAAAATAGPPKTAGLNPPPTARLPEHLRSPPSSKTQFLSLFSNFYDSLTDSRTLKATLEDQVRRSNTLLQTLQKSSRVLELTVDRRMREERMLWESKVYDLEERCRRLERLVGAADEGGSKSASPSPAGAQRSSPSQRIEGKNGAAQSPSAEAPNKEKEGSARVEDGDDEQMDGGEKE